jgi:hypothetical protein
MDTNLTVTEQNLRLAAAYHQMNSKGCDVLDTVIQKLAEVQWWENDGNKKVKVKNEE